MGKTCVSIPLILHQRIYATSQDETGPQYQMLHLSCKFFVKCLVDAISADMLLLDTHQEAGSLNVMF